jgi:alkanesulfonate monooxygenase SsuD/methylene tetrahydromethanopterin reductase-like flavin-dependent oxidoreductase (luciferase family)
MTNRLGYCLLSFIDMPIVEMGEVAKEAEELGYERAYTTESLTDSLAIHMVMAMKTERIVVGSFVIIIYHRHPHIAAQAAVAISEVSGGRYILGLGLGHPPRVQGMGMKMGKPREDMCHYLTELRGLLEGKRVYDMPTQTYQGEELRFRLPKHPVPVYSAAVGEKMTELGGELSDGLMLYMIPLSRMGKIIEARNRGAEKAGRNTSDIEVNLGIHTFLSDDLETARSKARETLTYWLALPAYNASIRESGYEAEAAVIADAFARGDQKALREGITDEIIDEFCLVGPAERCRERLDAFRSAGAEVPILMIDPAIPGEDYPTAMRRTLKGLAPSG